MTDVVTRNICFKRFVFTLFVNIIIFISGISYVDEMLRRLFETVYYFNFCCSIVIFLASGANFRAIFLSMYVKKLNVAGRVRTWHAPK